MNEPLTEDLLDELLNSPSPTDYVEDRQLQKRNLSQYLQQLLDEHGLVRKDVVRAAGIDATYGYQLFTGQRSNPSRDKTLALAFALGCSLRETDRLLQAAGASRLYVKERRDAIIVFCLDQGLSVDEVNETLYHMGEETLG